MRTERYTDNERLDKRIKAIMARLALLAGPIHAQKLERGVSQSKDETKAPPGAQPDRKSDRPDPDRSLFDYYAHRFAGAHNDRHRRFLCLRAEHEYRVRVLGESPTHTGNRSARVSEDEDARLIVRDLQGIPSEEIAAEAGWPIGWVETVRRNAEQYGERAAQDPDTGTPRPNFLRLSEEERTTLVRDHQLIDQWGSTVIARRLGVAKRTVQRYMLDPDEIAA